MSPTHAVAQRTHEATVRSDRRADQGGGGPPAGVPLFLQHGPDSDAPAMLASGGGAQATLQVGAAASPLESEAAEAAPSGGGMLRDRIAEYARHIPGWTLFTVILGFNPLTGNRVPRTAYTLISGLVGLVPFGTMVFDALRRYSVIREAFAFVGGQLGRLDLSPERIERTLSGAWADVRVLESVDFNVAVLRRHFGALYRDVEAFATSMVSACLRFIREAAIRAAEVLLSQNRAWALLKKILRRDPLRDEPVQASNVEILEDFLLLIEQEQHLQQMRERGTVDETAAWLATQIGTFTGLLAELRGLFGAAWDAIQPQNLPDLPSNLRALAAGAAGFLQRVWRFARTVATEVLRRIKDALLGWLAGYADEVPGFNLLTVILGRNPFTGAVVPRTAENLIRGFITLLPNGAAIYERLAESGAVAGAAVRIDAALAQLGITWSFIVGIFSGIWSSLSIRDLVNPVTTFARIVNRFGEPISRLVRFTGVVLREMIFLVLEMMSFPFELIGSIVDNAMQAVEDVKRDPIGFLQNMLAAVRQGFSTFFDNIVGHLVGGLSDWLFRGLRSAGIEPPRDLSIGAVLDFILQVLGVGVERIWEKLGERIGAGNVARIRGGIDRLTGIWTFIRDVQQRGIGAIWEYIRTQVSGLWDMVLEQARVWIMERIIARAVQWLLSLLDVTGVMPVINAFRSFFSAVQSAIEYLRDILSIINDWVTTIASVARGAISAGAQKLERGLASAIPVAIGFLANQFGLGNIGERIQEIVGNIRALVDSALDWLLDRAVGTLRSVMAALGFGGGEQEAEPAAAEEGVPVVEAIPEGLPPEEVKRLVLDTVHSRLAGTGFTSVRAVHGLLQGVLDANRARGLSSLRLRVVDADSMAVVIEAAASPIEGRRIAWSEIFTGSTIDAPQEIDRMRVTLSRASQASYAALAVDGRAIGSLSRSGGGAHAEEALVRSESWQDAVEAARQGVQANGAAQVTLVINRTPCASCVVWLSEAVQRARGSLGSAAGHVVFRLGATGTYRRQARLSPADVAILKSESERRAQRLGRPFDEVFNEQKRIWLEDLRSVSTEWTDDDGEEFSGLGALASAGWQIAGLDAGQPITARQLEIATIAERLAQQFEWG